MSEVALTPPPRSSTLRVITPKQTIRQQLRDMWQYRELLGGLVRKELKVKYKDSILGFLWSLLNPALYLVVYYLVFQVILGNGIPRFAIWILCGLLAWNFFSGALAGATGAVIANSSIVKKVAFPREILALASVGATLVHFFLQSTILVGALLVVQRSPALEYLPLVPLALLALVLLASALGILLSAVNVRFRDTEHLLELTLLVWFWATPIVYPYQLVAQKFVEHGWDAWLYRLNPITPIVLTFQRVFYNHGMAPETATFDGDHLIPDGSVFWYAGQLGLVVLGSAVLFFFALRVFGRMQADFAEEL